jgi:hypothetical protein
MRSDSLAGAAALDEHLRPAVPTESSRRYSGLS